MNVIKQIKVCSMVSNIEKYGYRKPLTLIIFTLIISGCAGLHSPGTEVKTVIERDGIDMVLIPANYREVYFSPESSQERHCRAPDPDFTVQSSDSFSVKESLTGASSAGFGGGEGEAAVTLGGRSPDVLITRELMFRACEMSSNIGADHETTVAIYSLFLEAIKVISGEQTAEGTVSAVDKTEPITVNDNDEN